MIGAKLMAYFMHYIVDIEIITLWDPIGRGCDTTSFGTVGANATDATGITAAAGSAEHMTDIIQLASPITDVRAGWSCEFQLDNVVYGSVDAV